MKKIFRNQSLFQSIVYTSTRSFAHGPTIFRDRSIDGVNYYHLYLLYSVLKFVRRCRFRYHFSTVTFPHRGSISFFELRPNTILQYHFIYLVMSITHRRFKTCLLLCNVVWTNDIIRRLSKCPRNWGHFRRCVHSHGTPRVRSIVGSNHHQGLSKDTRAGLFYSLKTLYRSINSYPVRRK